MSATQVPEQTRPRTALLRKVVRASRIALCIGLLLPLVLALSLLADQLVPAHNLDIGISFSPRYATAFGLDGWSTYLEMLDELQVRAVRLPMYWDEVEPDPGRFEFSRLDAYLDAAAVRRAGVLLVLGYKQPRWPECYLPDWARSLPRDSLQQHILQLVTAEVTHARRYSNVVGWQVENEPLVHFGECSFDVLTSDFVAEEISLVRGLDSRPIMLTDSGELSSWIPILHLPADDLGVTIYRDLWFRAWGSWQHPIPAWFYKVHDGLARAVLGRPGTTVLSELQAEAWFDSLSLWDVLPARQRQLFPPELVVTAHLDYARRMQFQQAYLWGVEWWYWMRTQGYPEYVDAARREIARDASSQGG
jgi:hypothetical protein